MSGRIPKKLVQGGDQQDQEAQHCCGGGTARDKEMGCVHRADLSLVFLITSSHGIHTQGEQEKAQVKAALLLHRVPGDFVLDILSYHTPCVESG